MASRRRIRLTLRLLLANVRSARTDTGRVTTGRPFTGHRDREVPHAYFRPARRQTLDWRRGGHPPVDTEPARHRPDHRSHLRLRPRTGHRDREVPHAYFRQARRQTLDWRRGGHPPVDTEPARHRPDHRSHLRLRPRTGHRDREVPHAYFRQARRQTLDWRRGGHPPVDTEPARHRPDHRSHLRLRPRTGHRDREVPHAYFRQARRQTLDWRRGGHPPVDTEPARHRPDHRSHLRLRPRTGHRDREVPHAYFRQARRQTS